MENLLDVEDYILHGKYPDRDLTKNEKTNLRRKCRNNYRIQDGILQYRVSSRSSCEDEDKSDTMICWKICVRSEEEKKRILGSCHAGMEGMISCIYI